MEAVHALETLWDKLSLLRTRIESAQNIALFGHDNIDCDAVWSILGFGRLLEKMWKNCSYFTTTAPAKSMSFIHGIEKVRTDFDYAPYDLVFFLDFTPYDRIRKCTLDSPEHTAYFDATYKIIIDHHMDDERIQAQSLEIKDINSTSNCGWLYEICTQLRPEHIDSDIATHWYMWLLTDSGNFMYGKDENAERDFMIGAGLLRHGARKAWLIQKLFYSNKPSLLDIAQKILGNAHLEQHTLYTHYTIDDLHANELGDDDTEVVQIVLKSMTWYAVYLRLRYMGTYRAGSLRSGYLDDWRRISVQQIARLFEWGGHDYAAGFGTPSDPNLSMEDDIKRIVAIVNKAAQEQIIQLG